LADSSLRSLRAAISQAGRMRPVLLGQMLQRMDAILKGERSMTPESKEQILDGLGGIHG